MGESGLSSRTDVRDLRFLPAVEMTERPTGTMYSVFRHRLKGAVKFGLDKRKR
jgi:hypothetical protein